ncbi:restriction endonuclease subunit S [Shewanella colwelliana]|uniref:restriction endonuclease subunit S n=1 Tax=Shewanella colwelliana TaxID=23 RepID=UPI00048C66B4|nr:restriction endonuclease subunit S [Shewanella colwelliana]
MSFEMTTLGEYIKVQGGYAYKSKDFIEFSKNKVLKIKNVRFGTVDYAEPAYVSDEIAASTKNWKVKEGDVLISMTGSGPNAPQSLVGRVARVWKNEPDAWINQRVGRVCLLDENSVHLDFIFYWLSLPQSQDYLVSNSSGSANQANISGKIIESLPCPKVDYQTSKQIADLARNFDEKVILNSQTNQTLEQMAQAIFKSWFVDFDPVKAKMNGDQPDGMDADTASLFPEKLVESELGLIPEGWGASSMGEHFNITMGQSPKGETYNEEGEGIAFFQGRRDFGFRYPDVRVFTTDPKRYAKAGDTLISVRAPVGDKNMAAIDCCIGRGVAAIKHKSESRSFTYAFVSHIEKKLGDSGSSGTVFSSINQNELKKVAFVAPPQALIDAFHKLVDPIDQKVEVLSAEIKSLSSLRDTLLPKLLSGEIELVKIGEGD